MSEFKVFKFITNETLRDWFLKGHLIQEWSIMYPMLFDDDDKRTAYNQAESHKAHYYEWLAAIIVYHAKGLLSLNQKYAYPSHSHKREILKKLMIEKSKIYEFIIRRGIGNVTQLPDLLVYQKDYKKWFFAEVKGLTDNLSYKQTELFKQLQQITGKKVVLIEFQTL
jgi:hypothetical protein